LLRTQYWFHKPLKNFKKITKVFKNAAVKYFRNENIVATIALQAHEGKIMDIKNLQNGLNNARNTDALKAQEKINTAATVDSEKTSKAPTDRVTLTSVSSQIRELEKRAAVANTNNEARIAELKQAIADGTYKVDAEKIADKLIKMEVLFAKA